MKKTFWFEIEV